MKYLYTFESFYEPIFSITQLNQPDFSDLTTDMIDLEKRILFFNYKDMEWSNKPIYFVLFADDNLIGVCKIDEYKLDKYKADYSISYESIEKRYQNKKLTRYLIEAMIDWLKKSDYTLSTSAWTQVGDQKLRPLVKSISSEKGVVFYDRKTLSDY